MHSAKSIALSLLSLVFAGFFGSCNEGASTAFLLDVVGGDAGEFAQIHQRESALNTSESSSNDFFLRGDVDGNGALNVADVQCTVLTALDLSPEDPASSPGCLADSMLADINCDGNWLYD